MRRIKSTDWISSQGRAEESARQKRVRNQLGRSPLGTFLLMSEQQPGSGGFHPRIPLIPRIGAHLGRPATGRERGRSGCGTDGVKTSHTTEGLVFTPPVSHSPRLRRAAGRPRIEEQPPPGINPRDPRNPRMIRSVAVLPRALLA